MPHAKYRPEGEKETQVTEDLASHSMTTRRGGDRGEPAKKIKDVSKERGDKGEIGESMRSAPMLWHESTTDE